VASTAGSRTAVVPWHGIREAPVILLTGPEGFLADRALGVLTDRMRSADPLLEVNDIDASTYSEGELLNKASPSLFGEPRLIRVSNAEKCTDAYLEDQLAYLQAPESGVVVVVRHGGGNRGKKLLDALKSAGASALVVECKEIKKDQERMAFISAEFSAAGVRIAPAAERALADAFTTDLAELASACSQLISDGQGAEVTLDMVNRYYGGRVEATTFQIADHAISGRTADAMVLLRHALNSGAEPVLVVAACAMKLRTMAMVGGSSGSVDQVASDLGMAPWQIRNARGNLRGWDEAGLGQAIIEVAATDAAVKGASRDPHYALERLVRIVSHYGKDPATRLAG
jgi:DNA polymerase III subunit delta